MKLQFFCMPCDWRKRPLTAHGEKDASNDGKQCGQWRAQFPGCNWAIATGPSNLIAVDEDCYKPVWKEGLLEEACQLEALPRTVEWRSARGGRVRIYRRPEGVFVKSRALKVLGVPGVDVKASTGYVLIPPSQNSEGMTYTWTNHPKHTPLADAPKELVEFLRREPEAESGGPSLTSESGELFLRSGDGRWERLRRFAGGMRRWGWGERAILGALCSFAKHQCEPDSTIEPPELARLARWASQLSYEARGPSGLLTLNEDLVVEDGEYVAVTVNSKEEGE